MDKTINTLPPCRVCGAPATGLHYGVISCEACKVFYRRSLARGDINVYECAEDRACDISCKNRNSCAFCRYQKCIKMGMSINAVKIGRYTYEMKASTMREAKISQSNVLKDSTVETSSSSNSSDHSGELMVSGNSINLKDISENSRLNTKDILKPGVSKQHDTTECRMPISCELDLNDFASDVAGSVSNCFIFKDIVLDTKSPPELITEHSIDKTMHSDGLSGQSNYEPASSQTYENRFGTINASDIECECPNHNHFESSQCVSNDNDENSSEDGSPEIEPKLYDVSKIEIYDQAIEKMYEKHKACVADDVNISETLSQAEHEYLEMIKLKQEIFGPLEPMPSEEYMSFYQETGLDIDGRKEICMDMFPILENNIRNHIAFAKTIPGFSDLSITDQIGLIKGSQSDFFMFSKHRCFNPELGLYSPAAGKVYHVDDISKLESDQSVPMFLIQQKIKKLNLSTEESVVLSAFCIMVTDNCDLEDPIRVENSQDFLLKCLFYLFDKQRPPGERGRFIRIVECLTEMRFLREGTSNLKRYIKFVSHCWGNIPPLVLEIMT